MSTKISNFTAKSTVGATDVVLVSDGTNSNKVTVNNLINGATVANFRSTGIDDNANALAFTIDSGERIIISHTASIGSGRAVGKLQMHATNDAGTIQSVRHAGSLGAHISVGQSRGAIGTPTIVQAGDEVGAYDWTAADGCDLFTVPATIRALVVGTPAADDVRADILLESNRGGGAQTTVEIMRALSNGSVTIGTAALATTATDGFLYIPSSAGAPTGTPTSQTGRVPIHYDSTNNDFYIYDGSWLKVAVA